MSLSPQPKPFRRRYVLAGLGVFVLLLAFVLFSQTSLNLSFIQPESTSEAILLAAFSALIFLLFVALTFVLARNLLKVFAERRVGVLGSRFRARMVIGALLLSFLPTIFLFLFSYVLMNRSIEKWFSRPVEQLSQDTASIADQVTTFAKDNATAKAKWLVTSAPVREAVLAKNMAAFDAALTRHADSMQGATVIVIDNGQPLHAWADGRSFIPQAKDLAKSDVSVTGSAPLDRGFEIWVTLPLPPQFLASLQGIEASQKGYAQLKLQQKQLRSFYMRLLLLLTVLTLFAATWISLFLARLVTRPVAALAEATQQIGAGHLGYRVEVAAADELAGLVASFNQMAMELEASRKRIESSGRALADANVALAHANTDLERRTTEISTILENIPTGVLSLDGNEKVMHSNRAFKTFFGKTRTEFDKTLPEVLEPALAADVLRLLRRADRMGTAAREVESGGKHLEVTVASLGGRSRSGYVVVFEDLSELLKAQKQSAWREVARRVAHEIKNPLTPILLSAERMRKHLGRGPVPDPGSMAVIQGSVDSISGAVETLRRLVDEFSTLARFPTAQPVPVELNEVVQQAIGMFNGRLDGITVRTGFSPSLPKIMADPEGLKRVVANLVDNAAEAMQESLVKEIEIRTGMVESEPGLVELSISDTGHGITPDLKERLFLPYFSTKDRGTGLGLAIVARVIEEHHGTIRVEENQPVGARFIVELPAETHA